MTDRIGSTDAPPPPPPPPDTGSKDSVPSASTELADALPDENSDTRQSRPDPEDAVDHRRESQPPDTHGASPDEVPQPRVPEHDAPPSDDVVGGAAGEQADFRAGPDGALSVPAGDLPRADIDADLRSALADLAKADPADAWPPRVYDPAVPPDQVPAVPSVQEWQSPDLQEWAPPSVQEWAPPDQTASGTDNADSGGEPPPLGPGGEITPPVPQAEGDPAAGPMTMAADNDKVTPGEANEATSDESDEQGDAADTLADTGQADKAEVTEDGRWRWKGLELSPEQNRVADGQLAALRRAEGRSEDGSYSGEGITPGMRQVESQLDHGSLIANTEKFALKSDDRFKEKFAKSIGQNPDSAPEELAANIPDGIRYTFQFDDGSYSEGVQETQDRLKETGYERVEFRPSWGSDEYKGINSRWRDPDSGQLFEVQFHTPASLDAKEKMHDSYERGQNPATPREERTQIQEYQRQVAAGVPIPPGALDFVPYKK